MITTSRAFVVSLTAALFTFAPAHAQQYPTKPIRFIVPFPPGGATDIGGRYVAQKLGESLGQTAIVDNRGGANGTIGLELTAKSPPDGHTLVLGQTGNLAISPGLTKVGYDPVRDFAPVSLAFASPHMLTVHPSLPNTLKAFVALARARPGQINYASTGSGSAGHLTVELLKKAAKIDLVHVPYKGAAPGLADLMAGHVGVMFTSALSSAGMVKSGKVRALAIASLQRSPAWPDVPTVSESGYPGFEATTWWGVLGPAGMSKDVVTRLHGEIVKIMSTAEAKDRIGALGADIMTNTPDQFAAYIAKERAKWGQVIKDSGARVD